MQNRLENAVNQGCPETESNRRHEDFQSECPPSSDVIASGCEGAPEVKREVKQAPAPYDTTDDEIEALRLDRDEWRARASYAESEMSAAFGLPPTFGPAPGEAVRTVAELRKIADTQTKKAAQARRATLLEVAAMMREDADAADTRYRQWCAPHDEGQVDALNRWVDKLEEMAGEG